MGKGAKSAKNAKNAKRSLKKSTLTAKRLSQIVPSPWI